MEDGHDNRRNDREEIFSRPLRAGKRTYFFDVKSTRGNEHYLTITESKKKMTDDGRFIYEKHKIFLYREDFESFTATLNECMNYINQNSSTPAQSRAEYRAERNENQSHNDAPAADNNGNSNSGYKSDISFDDLGK